MPHDTIPPKDADFNNWVVPFNDQVQTNHTASPTWMGLTNAQVMDLDAAVTVWADAYAVTLNPTTAGPLATQAKNEARTALEVLLRPLIRQLQANPAMTDDIRASLGIHIASHAHTPAPVPATAPQLTVGTGEHLTHGLDFRDAAAPTRRGKPAGVRGCEIHAKVGGAAPASLAELALVANATASPYALHFDMAQAGLTVYYRARWVNPTGQPGPWSDLVTATIPG